jgi:hypothetical protein
MRDNTANTNASSSFRLYVILHPLYEIMLQTLNFAIGLDLLLKILFLSIFLDMLFIYYLLACMATLIFINLVMIHLQFYGLNHWKKLLIFPTDPHVSSNLHSFS